MNSKNKRNKYEIFKNIFCIIALIIILSSFYFVFISQSFKRKIVDLKSEYGGGLERVINIYTANGDLIATYQGKIDLDTNNGGYVKFDYDGKRYIYYNCYIETIADIE